MPQPRHEKKFLYKALLFANACKNPFYTAPCNPLYREIKSEHLHTPSTAVIKHSK